MKDEELTRTIAKLHADYAAQLPSMVAQMNELWRALVAAEIPLSRLPELTRMAHSITGAGATFGIPDASQAARELEEFLDQTGKSGKLPGAKEQEKVAALLVALAQAAILT